MAITVAVSMLAMLMVVGIAVDVLRVFYAREALQSAMDSAMTAAAARALSEVTDSTPDAEKMKDAAIDFFSANNKLGAGIVTDVTFVPDYVAEGDLEDSMTATLDAKVVLTLGTLLGMKEIPIQLKSVARRPRAAPVEMAIVLDTTESMADAFGSSTKMAALKSSAKELVSVLMKSDYAKVGLLPFGWLIRLDNTAGYYDKNSQESLVPWLTFGTKPVIYDCFAWQKTDCRSVDTTCYRDGVPYTCTTTVCDSQVCTDSRLRPVTWDGCVYLRPPPSRTVISNPTSPKYVGVWSAISCAYAPVITDLVTKGQTYMIGGASYTAEDFLKAKIDAMPIDKVGGTYIPGALIWAWNMLTTEANGSAIDPNYPLNSGFTAAEVAKRGVRKAIVLITDGNNSLFATNGGPYIGGADSLGNIQNILHTPTRQQQLLTEVNADMVTICNNIKSMGIKIYIIGLQISATDIAYKAKLRDECANQDGEYYFDVSDPAKLREAFLRIGKSLSYNSLTR